MRVLQPENWVRPRGYANGIEAEGKVIFVAGQIGWNEKGEFKEHTLAGQFRQALSNALTVLKEASAGPEHIARMTIFVTSRGEYVAARPDLGTAWKELMGRNFPAMAVIIVTGFIEPEAKVEIETTAVVPR